MVDACLRLVLMLKPRWWALENPQGYLANWLGEPKLRFDPYEYGDPWTKRTWIWGDFAPPMYRVTQEPRRRLVGAKRNDPVIAQTFEERARTPAGFAQQFFEANP